MEEKFRSLHPREPDKIVRIFSFFNGAFKKIRWMGFVIKKIECWSADVVQYGKTLTKKTVYERTTFVQTDNFFNFQSSTNMLARFVEEIQSF